MFLLFQRKKFIESWVKRMSFGMTSHQKCILGSVIFNPESIYFSAPFWRFVLPGERKTKKNQSPFRLFTLKIVRLVTRDSSKIINWFTPVYTSTASRTLVLEMLNEKIPWKKKISNFSVLFIHSLLKRFFYLFFIKITEQEWKSTKDNEKEVLNRFSREVPGTKDFSFPPFKLFINS